MSRLAAVLLLLASTALSSPVFVAVDSPDQILNIRDGNCGWYNQLTCSAGQSCVTVNNQASCAAAQATAAPVAGGSGLYTTTWTVSETFTYTSTVSGAAPANTGTCDVTTGHTLCGVNGANLCCDSSHWCNPGVGCMALIGNSPSPGAPATVIITTMTSGSMTTTISNFIAPTTLSVTTITSTGTATTTQPFQTPIGSSGSSLTGITAQPQNTGLSGGAIAGIVIGVLLALFILFIVLACLCCKGIFHALFGSKKKKETTTYIQTHHSSHGSVAHRPPPRRWFGVLPGKVDRPDRPEKKSSGLGGLLAVGGGLAALAMALGLKRKNDRRRDDEKSEYTVSDDYSYDYYSETSASSASSDRQTRNTRHSSRR